jgi:predicted nucleic acid-binding protein
MPTESAGALAPEGKLKDGHYSVMKQLLVDLILLPIYCDQETNDHVLDWTLELADRNNLTVYDATYLELVLCLSLPLATLDDDLRHAAQQEGVPLLGK